MVSLRASLLRLLLICFFVTPLLHAATPTVITLAVTPSNVLTAQQVITLTASVRSADQPVSVGTVEFYDGKLYLGSVQVVRNTIHGYAVGTATLRTALSTGLHKISAIFDPTAAYTSSISADQTITVSGAAASTGTFSPGGSVTAALPQSVESADLNKDGFPDISFVGFPDARSFTLGQIMNHGDGTFGYPPTVTPPTNGDLIYGPGSGSESIYADYDGDGVLDYASESNSYVPAVRQINDKMTVNFGAGDGTFPTGVVLISPAESPSRVLGRIDTGDFNGDGIPDLIVTDMPASNSPVLNLFTGKGDGTFNPPIANPQMAGITSMVVKDFNRDGFADMAVTVTGQDAVLVLIGKGDGTFLSPVSYATDNTPTLATALQSRGNGDTDLAVLNSGDNTLGILLGSGDGTFLAQRSYPLTAPTTAVARQIVVADVTGDGLQDVITRNSFAFDSSGTNLPGSFSVLAGNGDGSFQPLVEYSSFPTYYFHDSLVATDFDRDGVADLAVASSGDYKIYTLLSRLRPDPTFTLAANPSTLTIAAGKTGSATLTLTPQNGFNGTVQLSCTGLPANSTCSFAPATLGVTGAPLTTTVTIATNVAAASLQRLTPVFSDAAISFACLFGFLSLARLRATRERLDIRRSSLVLAVSCFFATTFFVGCNGGSNSDISPTPSVPQTPIGTSVVAITAVASGANAVSKASQLTVTIVQ